MQELKVIELLNGFLDDIQLKVSKNGTVSQKISCIYLEFELTPEEEKLVGFFVSDVRIAKKSERQQKQMDDTDVNIVHVNRNFKFFISPLALTILCIA